MIPNPRVPQGKRHSEGLLNGLSSRLKDASPASTTLGSSQTALMADLLRPGWLRILAFAISTRPLPTTDAAGPAPAGLQLCRLFIRRPRRLSLRQLPPSLRFLPPAPLLLSLPHSQISCHDSKSPCSVGEATPGAATREQGTGTLPLSPARRLFWGIVCGEFRRFAVVPSPLDRHNLFPLNGKSGIK
jgi:hypothetical protein